MTHIIGSPCIGTKDTACVQVCPVDCIHPYPDGDGQEKFDAAEQLYIDPDTCIDCGACVPECPVSAIWPEAELPAEQQPFIQKNIDYYKNS